MFSKLALVATILAAAAQADVGAWGQCGGTGWTGSTVCVSGYVCTFSNAWYSQCIPGSPASSSTTTKTTAAPTGTVTPTTTTKGSATTTLAGGSGPGATLQSGYYWIRAVEAPNFHKYLQTSPQYTTGTAIMADYTTAGQFNIVNGQLVELITGGTLYAVVTPASGSEQTLSVSFSKTQNTYGTFAFSGDAVTWSVSTITRPNPAAWFVCAGQQLLINLGNYLSGNAPAGCADETIHYYNGATAVS